MSNDCRRSTTGRLLYSQDDPVDDQEDAAVSTPTTPTTSQNTNQSPKPPAKKRDTPSAKKNDTPSTPKNKPKANDTSVNSKNTPKRNDTPKPKAPKNEPSKKRTNSDQPTSSQKKAKIDLAPKRKPFNKLLEGVVFAISGYQNPYRAELRSKALKMGAKYRADWDDLCTHLM